MGVQQQLRREGGGVSKMVGHISNRRTQVQYPPKQKNVNEALLWKKNLKIIEQPNIEHCKLLNSNAIAEFFLTVRREDGRGEEKRD
jgi:hypothetical protein